MIRSSAELLMMLNDAGRLQGFIYREKAWCLATRTVQDGLYSLYVFFSAG